MFFVAGKQKFVAASCKVIFNIENEFGKHSDEIMCKSIGINHEMSLPQQSQ